MTQGSRRRSGRPARDFLLAATTLVVVGLAGCAPARLPEGVDPQRVAAERARLHDAAAEQLFEYQKSIFRVGSRVLVASADLCPDPEPHIGMLAASRADLRRLFGDRDYGEQVAEALARRFDVADSVRVLYVIPGSPAERAGLAAGDWVRSGATDLANRTQRLEINRNGTILNARFPYQPRCPFPIRMAVSDIVDAATTGRLIIINTGMLRFTRDDAELALVIGHEVAHNLLGHTRGSNEEFERQADYLGTYLAARAGFDVSGAPAFWRRRASQNPRLISGRLSQDHPGMPQRVVEMEATTREILDKLERGESLTPTVLAVGAGAAPVAYGSRIEITAAAAHWRLDGGTFTPGPTSNWGATLGLGWRPGPEPGRMAAGVYAKFATAHNTPPIAPGLLAVGAEWDYFLFSPARRRQLVNPYITIGLGGLRVDADRYRDLACGACLRGVDVFESGWWPLVSGGAGVDVRVLQSVSVRGESTVLVTQDLYVQIQFGLVYRP